MDGIYFPVTMREFGARVSFRDIGEQDLEIDGVEIRTMLLAHPGRCLGYRLRAGGRTICYVTDNELFPADLPQHDAHYRGRLADFVSGADILISDATYLDEAYGTKVGWGHSAVGEIVRLGHEAGVKQLHLFHHDPDQTDDDIDRKKEQAGRILQALGSQTTCIIPAEGALISLRLQ
jgi:phosphoribosyl 1,2-cyclic phosphodiesterase